MGPTVRNSWETVTVYFGLAVVGVSPGLFFSFQSADFSSYRERLIFFEFPILVAISVAALLVAPKWMRGHMRRLSCALAADGAL